MGRIIIKVKFINHCNSFSKRYCYHIDDVQDNLFVGNVLAFKDKSLSEIFSETMLNSTEDNIYMRMMAGMLRSVVYVACSKVIDDKPASAIDAAIDFKCRSIQRIELLIQLIENKPEFVRALVQHIARLQLEREETLQGPSKSKNWLFNEVFNFYFNKILNIGLNDILFMSIGI